MTINVYLDESGSIHKNSKTAYFAIGGYVITNAYKQKVIAHYRKINKKIKDLNHLPLEQEIKAIQMTNDEKINFLTSVQDIPTFFGCAKIFVKHKMAKEIVGPNIFFNYAVKILFLDCIIPTLKKKKLTEPILFILSVDNRNIRVGDLNNLENYLNTEFCLENYHFQITYYDSKTNYGIQLADLIVNTFYNFYKNKAFVQEVIKKINMTKFKVTIFPKTKKFFDKIRKSR